MLGLLDELAEAERERDRAYEAVAHMVQELMCLYGDDTCNEPTCNNPFCTHKDAIAAARAHVAAKEEE